jgi:hypothetical protein
LRLETSFATDQVFIDLGEGGASAYARWKPARTHPIDSPNKSAANGGVNAKAP